MIKRVFSLVLCLLMLVSVIPFSVSAGSYADEYKVKEIWIYDVQLPYAEYYPDYDFTIRSSAYTFDTDRASGTGIYNGCWWYDETDENVMDYDDPFIKGHTYKLIILLETNDGYEFQTDNFGTPYFKAYINGNEAIVEDSLTTNTWACVEYTFAPSDYNMEVEYVNITVTEPETGKHPDFSATTDRQAVRVDEKNSVHYIQGVAWYDYTTHTFMDPSDTFRENGVYEANILIETTGDFYFSTNGNTSDVNAYVNGNKATVSYGGEDINHYLLVSYAFGDVYQEVSKVEIRNLTTPKVGETPDFELTPFAADAYYINGVFWTDHTNSGSPVTMKETDVFEAGHTYELQVWLRASDGYKFRIDEDEYIDIVAYIDGEAAEVSEAGNEIAAIIYMDFTIPESRVISEVDVVGVDKPYAGEKPDLDAFCITQGCNVSSVKWYDVTDGGYTLMEENDTFIAGHIYRVNIMVDAEGNYTFLMVDCYNEAWGYINGIRAIAGASDDDTWLQLGYVFPACEENPNPTTTPTNPTDPEVTGILGDANEDGVVNIKDATAIQKHVASIIPLTDTGLILADVDANNNVNIKDATAIQKYLAGIDTGLSIGKSV